MSARADPCRWRDLWVRSASAELRVSECGEGPVLLALHAGVNDRRAWRWCAPIWSRAGYRVVTYDRRGFGQTRYEPELHDDLVDLRAVTEAVEGRPAVVVGNSMGGSLAIDLALDHPGEVAALVLVGALPSGAPDELWTESEQERSLAVRIDGAAAAGDLDEANRLEVHYWLDGPAQAEGRVTGAARDLMLDMNGRALRAADPGPIIDRPAAWPRLGELSVPTLVVVGEYDESGLAPLLEAMVQTTPVATLARMPGTAHCPSLDRPGDLARQVLAFLAPQERKQD